MEGKAGELGKKQMEAFGRVRDEVENVVILGEFVKEFVSMLTHRNRFEGTIEELFTLYSLMLDDYYFNQEDFSVRDD